MNATYLFPLLVNLFLCASAFYLGRRLIRPKWPRWVRYGLWIIILLMAFSMPMSFLLRSYWLTLGHVRVIRIIQYAMGFYSILLFLTVMRDVFLLIVRMAESLLALWQKRRSPTIFYKRNKGIIQRRFFLRESTRWGVFALTAGVFGRAAYNANAMKPTVVRVDVPIAHLPAALDGVTIAQISDLHVGQIRHEQQLIRDVVDTINGLNVDIIALTGDFTDGMVSQLHERVAPLGQLRAKYGRYFVTGNHEYYTDKVENWLAEWASLGFTLLQNQHEVLNIQGAPLVVAGVNDLRSSQRHPTHVCSPQQALAGAPSAPTILLAHHPDVAQLTENLPVDLQLSGHTHGGQYFPGTLIVRWVHDFKVGLNPRGDGWVFVNSGTGYWGSALRTTDVASEISLLTLRRA